MTPSPPRDNNPYSSPDAPAGPSPTTEQQLARYMLEVREEGYTAGLFLRRNSKGYLIQLTQHVAAIALCIYAQQWNLIYVIAGMIIGKSIRDLSWFRGIRKTWPLSEKVTDWEKVQRIADGELVD